MRKLATIALASLAVFATAGSSAAGPREKTFIAVADAYVQAPGNVRTLSRVVAGAAQPGKPSATKKAAKPAPVKKPAKKAAKKVAKPAAKKAAKPAKSAPAPASSSAKQSEPTPANPAPVSTSAAPSKPEQGNSTDKGSDKSTDTGSDKSTDTGSDKSTDTGSDTAKEDKAKEDKAKEDKAKEDKGSGNDGKALRVDAKPIRVSYLRFRVEGIAGGIRKATLRLHAESTSAIGFEVRAVESDSWNESKLTWLNAPPFSSTVVGSSGSLAKDRWIEIDVTRGVTRAGSVSFALVTRSAGEIKLASRETGKTAPQLVVQFGGSPPTPVNDTVETNEDTPLVIAATTLTANDSDPDGDPLTVTGVSSNADTHGTVALSGGIVRYEPAPNYNGPASFGYTVSDGNATAGATVAVTVRPVNDAPNVVNRAVETDEDTPLAINLAGSDVDGDALTITTTTPSHGTFAGGTYTPDANFNGPDSFEYTANDGNGGSDSATVTITVKPVNDAPSVANRAVETNEDSSLAIDLGGSDVDGDTLTITTTAPSHGSFAGGSYTPAANYNGPDSFEYTASDGNGGSDTATVSITVKPVNDAPSVIDRAVETDEDTPLAIDLGGSDVDGDALTITTTTPSHGSFVGGSYTPAANYNGPDSFEYTASDGNGGSDTATVSITVLPVNDAPSVANRVVETDEDSSLAIDLAGSDVDGDSLTITSTAPSHGSFAGGTYTPSANYNGSDSFEYTASDGNGGSDTATVTITVKPVNDAPNAANRTVETDEDTPLAIDLAGSDVDGDSLMFAVVSGPANGTLGEVSGNKATYTPAAGFDGSDSFTFKASDGSLDSNVATVSITVRKVDPQPSFPIRAGFYYPWFPSAWTQGFFPFTKFTPSAGYYDSGSAAVIASHIAEMRYGKIEAGLASWWGQGHHTDGRVPALLAGAAGTPFRWALYHEQESLGNPTVAELQSDLTYIRDKYGNDPSYLRVNGKFVVFAYGAPGESCEMAERWHAANTVGAYIVLKVFSGYRDPVSGCKNKVDAWHQYAPAVAADRQPGYSYTISPGFHLATEAGPQLGRDPARWRQNIRAMVASGEPWQLVTTFNEWGEGTSVEAARQWPSSSGHGDYLDALHDDGAEPASSDPVLLAAGDIASCSLTGDESTATLLGLQPEAKVATLGDNAYENGSTEEFTNCYDPSWGAAKARTFPSVGNHEYKTPGASGYFGYFGGAAGDPAKGYYSYDLGAWHVLVVNSNCSQPGIGCGAGTLQEQWVRADLAASSARCTLAYWHHPRFSSGTNHGSTPEMQPIWQALYEGGADLVLQGHEHHYERFGPLTAGGLHDSAQGIRSIVVGTGGKTNNYPFGFSLPASEVRQTNVLGVVELTLHGDSWDWEFLPIGGQSFTDSGSATCNEGGGSPPPLLDTTPPDPPTGVTAVAISPTRVDVDWLPAADDIGVKDYEIQRDGPGTPLTRTRLDTDLSDTTVVGATTYRYTIVARDAAGNKSAPSESVEVTTPATPGATLTFPKSDAPATDTFVRSDQPASNFGSRFTIEIDGGASDGTPILKQALLKFEVSGIAGRRILRAVLRLNAVDGSNHGGDFFGTADAGWLETAVTWATAPAAIGAPVASLGEVDPGTAYDVVVTPLVTGDGTVSIRIASTSLNGADYASKENPNAALAPQLLVEVE